MTTLNVALIDQTLVVAEKIKIASGDIDSVFLAVEFDSSWDEFTNRSASFYTSHDSRPHEPMLIDNQCVVPPEVLANPGILYVGVIGIKADGSAVKTSTYASFRIVQGAQHAYTTVSPELSLYQQYLKATKEETSPIIKAMQADYAEVKAKLADDYAKTKEELETDYAQSKPVLLWENASTTSAFVEQTITVPGLSGYEKIGITFNWNSNAALLQETAIHIFHTGVPRNIGCVALQGSFGSRTFQTSGDSITFRSGYEESFVSNFTMIPVKIYGIK